jgi:signal transduction histidine kinase
VAVAVWALVSAAHSLPQSLESQMLWTKAQYFAIFSVPTLWILFAADYVGVAWLQRRAVRRALWVVPALMLIVVLTNEQHHLYFTGSDRVDGVTVYRWGSLFWVSAAHSYLLMAGGSLIMLRGLWLFPPPFRSQTFLFVFASLIPWFGNIAYVSRLTRPGFDPTSVLFSVSLVLFFWGIYAHRMFDVVPMARAAVFERLGDAVFVLDGAFRVVDANAAAMALVGDRQKTVIGRHPAEFLPWWHTMPKPPAPADGEPQVARVGEKILEVQAAKLPLPGNYLGSLLWIRDVSNRHRLEQRLREQERLESLTVMAAGLAHDFNNLLTAMLGNADYLASLSPEGSDQRDSAVAIAAAAQHAADLVTQIVAFSGQGRAIVVPVSIEDAVSDTIQALARTLRTRALITHESHPDLPRVPADAVQVRQAVLALLTNAVDAVTSTHGSVDVFTGREHLDADALGGMTYSAAEGPGDYVFVEVKDDGPGISPEVMTRIFEPFFSTRDFARGLGLAAVHGIVRGHKGAIRVWSAPGEGTRARIWWPL